MVRKHGYKQSIPYPDFHVTIQYAYDFVDTIYVADVKAASRRNAPNSWTLGFRGEYRGLNLDILTSEADKSVQCRGPTFVEGLL